MEEMAISKIQGDMSGRDRSSTKDSQANPYHTLWRAGGGSGPSDSPKKNESWIGCMKSTGVIKGDIVSPVVDEEDWEVLKS